MLLFPNLTVNCLWGESLFDTFQKSSHKSEITHHFTLMPALETTEILPMPRETNGQASKTNMKKNDMKPDISII